MTLVFWADVAPIHVRSFLRYCDEGFYDGLTYHRIMRDFMIQGGCPNGIGNGDGPHGNLKAEFSKDKKYAHKYGVLSMARDRSPDSASCQFFICCEETPSVHNLDGNYTGFGMLVNGVKTLEAIADTKVKPGPGGGSPSSPVDKVTIDKVEVVHGAPTETESVVMPEPDLGGEPAKVSVQHILIAFKGSIPSASRSKEEAEKLALDVFEKAKACKTNAEYTALVREFTDDSVRPGDENPGVYAILNNKVRRDADFEKKYTELKAQFDALQADLKVAVETKAMTKAEADAETQRVGMRLQSELEKSKGMPRGNLVPAFGDVGFKLEVGQVGLAPYDKNDSKYGWHIIRRVR
jgi:peptidyl-prolyl cis-trans isomerase B (cyclophilin B)